MDPVWIKEYLPEIDREGYEVTGIDINPDFHPEILHDIAEPFDESLHGQFDAIVASHVMEHVSWRKALASFGNLKTILTPTGYFLVIVPALEHAMRRILHGQFDPGVMGVIYGDQREGQHDYHFCGYTRAALVQAMEFIDMQVVEVKELNCYYFINGQTFRGTEDLILGQNRPPTKITN